MTLTRCDTTESTGTHALVCNRPVPRAHPPPTPQEHAAAALQLFADELARSGVEVPHAARTDPVQYEAFVRAKYEEMQWAAAGGGGDSTGALRKKGGFFGKARAASKYSKQPGPRLTAALQPHSGSSSGVPAEVVPASNPLLAILDEVQVNVRKD